jgi:hypothetical protein
MKKIVLLVTGLFLTLGLPQAQALDPSVTIDLYASVAPSPVLPEIWSPYLNNVHSFLAGVIKEAPSIDPGRFHAITAGSWRYLCMDLFGKFPFWLAEPTPGTPQRGSVIVFIYKIFSPTDLALSDVKTTITSWGTLNNALGKVTSFQTYSLNVVGTKAGGMVLTSGPASELVREIRCVWPFVAYSVHTQEDLNRIRDVCLNDPKFGLTCLVEVSPGGSLVARKQLDLPFINSDHLISPKPSSLTQVSKSMLRVNGVTNQQYRLQSKASFGASWKTFGLPVFSGEDVIVPDTAGTLFRAFQGEP